MTEFSMVELAEAVVDRGVPAFIEHTGGGCATIFAGALAFNPETGEARWPACAGPGRYEFGLVFADTEEFWIGPDDDGTTKPIEAIPGWSIDLMADAIVATVRSRAAEQRIIRAACAFVGTCWEAIGDEATSFTCSEADLIAELYASCGYDPEEFLQQHAEHDTVEDGDLHAHLKRKT
jgi:hypothetical protein